MLDYEIKGGNGFDWKPLVAIALTIIALIAILASLPRGNEATRGSGDVTTTSDSTPSAVAGGSDSQGGSGIGRFVTQSGLTVDDKTGSSDQALLSNEADAVRSIRMDSGVEAEDGPFTRIKASDSEETDKEGKSVKVTTSYWSAGGTYYRVITIDGNSTADVLTETVEGVNDAALPAASVTSTPEDPTEQVPEKCEQTLYERLEAWNHQQGDLIDTSNVNAGNNPPEHVGSTWTFNLTAPKAGTQDGVTIKVTYDETNDTTSFAVVQ